MVDTEWIEIGRVIGDTGMQGEKGDTGVGTVIRGSFDSLEELIANHPSGNVNDAYLIDGNFYYWSEDESGWLNAGSIKGDTGDRGIKGDTGSKGDTGDRGATGETGASGFSPTISVDHLQEEIIITSECGTTTISFDELKGEKGDTGDSSDEKSGWKLPVDEIRTTNDLPDGVSAGYRVAIVTSSVMAIKTYNGSSWDIENLDEYSIIPLKMAGSIQMYLAKTSGPVYAGVDFGIFGKFQFMTQTEYDALDSYDEDTIYFVRS